MKKHVLFIPTLRLKSFHKVAL